MSPRCRAWGCPGPLTIGRKVDPSRETFAVNVCSLRQMHKLLVPITALMIVVPAGSAVAAPAKLTVGATLTSCTTGDVDTARALRVTATMPSGKGVRVMAMQFELQQRVGRLVAGLVLLVTLEESVGRVLVLAAHIIALPDPILGAAA